MRTCWIGLVALLAHAMPAHAQDVLAQDFGSLKNLGKARTDPILSGSWNRVRNRNDHMVGISYGDEEKDFFVDVTVQSFGDGTWVLHEFEGAFRSNTGEAFDREMVVVDSGGRRRFDVAMRGAGSVPVGISPPNSRRIVAWPTANNTLVAVWFVAAGPGRTEELPTALVDAYLALHPSVLPADVVDTLAHHQEWIRDEMRRLLAYAERDLTYSHTLVQQISPAEWRRKAEALLIEFAGYRERFFASGSQTAFERAAEQAELAHVDPRTNDIDVGKHVVWLEGRLRECQIWWQVHQNDPVQFPTPVRPTPSGAAQAPLTPH